MACHSDDLGRFELPEPQMPEPDPRRWVLWREVDFVRPRGADLGTVTRPGGPVHFAPTLEDETTLRQIWGLQQDLDAIRVVLDTMARVTAQMEKQVGWKAGPRPLVGD